MGYVRNIKYRNRTYKRDLGGVFFLKAKLKFRFIKKWIQIFEENILKVKRNFPEILKSQVKRMAFKNFLRRRFKFRFNKFKKINKNNFSNFSYNKYTDCTRFFIGKYRNKKHCLQLVKKALKRFTVTKKQKDLVKLYVHLYTLRHQNNLNKSVFNKLFIKNKNNQPSDRFVPSVGYNNNKYNNKGFKNYSNKQKNTVDHDRVTVLSTYNTNRRDNFKNKRYHSTFQYNKSNSSNNSKFKYRKKYNNKYSKPWKRQKYKPQKFVFKFDFFKYDMDKEFKYYYFQRKIKSVIKYKIHYDKFFKRTLLKRSIFYKKQFFKGFFSLKEKQFKKIALNSKKSGGTLFYNFFYNLEYRIDVLLFRCFFFPSLKAVQQFIKNFGVYINNCFCTNYSYLVKIGDQVKLSKSKNSIFFLKNLVSKKILVTPPNYLEVNYINFSIYVKSYVSINLVRIFKSMYIFNERAKFLNKLHYKEHPFFYLLFYKKEYSKMNHLFFNIQSYKYLFSNFYYPFSISPFEIELFLSLY